jgi:multiple antibiotic resistance protein
MNYLHRFIEAFVPLLVAIDPLGLVPLFVSLTSNLDPAARRRVSTQAVLVAAAVTLAFMLVGNELFRLIGITMADFQIAGGVLLLVLAVTDLLLMGKPAIHDAEMVGLVPLAMPLVAGPATLTTALVLVSRPGLGLSYTVAAIAVAYLILLIVLVRCDWFVRVIGVHALTALSKLVMVLLAAIAVSFVRNGVVLAMHQQ